MEHADTVPHFKRRGSSKPVSIRTLSMSLCFCFGVQPRHRSWACCPASCELCGDRRSLCWEPILFAFQQAWLCAPVLCLWWGRAFDAQNHQHHTWGSSPWYRRFASGFVEEDVFVGSARCATFRLCSRALRTGTTQCIQEHRSSDGVWGSAEETVGSDCVHLKDVDMLHQRCNGRKLSQFQPRVMLSLAGKNSWCIDLPRSGSFWNFACSTLDKHQHVFFVGSTLQKFNSSPPENRPGPKRKA